MGYEVSARCDVRKGNPLEKKRCHSDAQAKIKPIVGEAREFKNAKNHLDRLAQSAGWRRHRRVGWPTIWVCPVCPLPGVREESDRG